eukprot:TRINITY_DN31193_c0_g1_i1.p1 TRINITY_DN31193_c0_g1~~TRINITY_DN31193_c0_g1_i1.p1  ORF type:complete len:430 (+),score=74.48 TRINITY_DN31193_c0_g1_i1:1743-3032(+)
MLKAYPVFGCVAAIVATLFFAAEFLEIKTWFRHAARATSGPSGLLATSSFLPVFSAGCLQTNESVCVTEAFAAMDELDQQQNVWPSVDLIVRAAGNPSTLGVLEYMFRSVELFWPKNVGRVIAVFDAEDEGNVQLALPPYVTVFYETVPPELQATGGRYFNQWSQFWADNYTDAEYIVYIDSDSMLSTKVTYDLLFRDTPNGRRSILIGSKEFQKGGWQPATEWYLRRPEVANFMDQLPMIFPRSMLAPLRDYVVKQHPECKSFDHCVLLGGRQPAHVVSTFVAYGVMGNFMYYEMPDAALILLEETDEPWLRYGVHVPYSRKMVEYSRGQMLKFSAEFVFVASKYLQEGICHSFPPGSFGPKECTGRWYDEFPRIHWEYGLVSNWGHIVGTEPRWNTTKYDLSLYNRRHFEYKHSLYWTFVDSRKPGS